MLPRFKVRSSNEAQESSLRSLSETNESEKDDIMRNLSKSHASSKPDGR